MYEYYFKNSKNNTNLFRVRVILQLLQSISVLFPWCQMTPLVLLIIHHSLRCTWIILIIGWLRWCKCILENDRWLTKDFSENLKRHDEKNIPNCVWKARNQPFAICVHVPHSSSMYMIKKWQYICQNHVLLGQYMIKIECVHIPDNVSYFADPLTSLIDPNCAS